MVLYAGKGMRALECIIHTQCASARGVYLGVDVFIAAGSRIAFGSSASNQQIDTSAIILDDTLLPTVYGLMIVIMTSCAHCHTIIHIQSCNDVAHGDTNHAYEKLYLSLVSAPASVQFSLPDCWSYLLPRSLAAS